MLGFRHKESLIKSNREISNDIVEMHVDSWLGSEFRSVSFDSQPAPLPSFTVKFYLVTLKGLWIQRRLTLFGDTYPWTQIFL